MLCAVVICHMMLLAYAVMLVMTRSDGALLVISWERMAWHESALFIMACVSGLAVNIACLVHVLTSNDIGSFGGAFYGLVVLLLPGASILYFLFVMLRQHRKKHGSGDIECALGEGRPPADRADNL